MKLEDAIAAGLIEQRFGGWGCYTFEHPQFAELCGLAAEQNRLDAEARAERELHKEKARADYQSWWDSRPKVFVRFGKCPASGRSVNHRDSVEEAGVSAYEAVQAEDGKLHLKPQISALLSGPGMLDRPAYALIGEKCGIGSDGEPVVAVQRVRRLKGRVLVYPIIGEVVAK